ncbi:MAG: Hsp20/alpha crystallin family protein [Hyphomicrobiales bacterium]|nr:Hsp20/alpha crystallin family protein [Hyphomicrobiales bacterium]
MSDGQEITTRTAGAVQGKETGSERTAGLVLRPPVDVFEDADGVTLVLDMPGVSKERLSVQTDKNTLTVEGDVQIAMQEQMEALYAEVHSTRYRRSFTLSGELEAEKAAASLKDGVLTLQIPKRADLRPRRIEVRAV